MTTIVFVVLSLRRLVAPQLQDPRLPPPPRQQAGRRPPQEEEVAPPRAPPPPARTLQPARGASWSEAARPTREMSGQPTAPGCGERSVMMAGTQTLLMSSANSWATVEPLRCLTTPSLGMWALTTSHTTRLPAAGLSRTSRSASMTQRRTATGERRLGSDAAEMWMIYSHKLVTIHS